MWYNIHNFWCEYMEKYKILAEVLLDISKIPITSDTYTDEIEQVLTRSFDASFVTWFKPGKNDNSFIFTNQMLNRNNRIESKNTLIL